MAKQMTVFAAKQTKQFVKFYARFSKQLAKRLHHHLAKRPHGFMLTKWRWYARWHSWKYHAYAHGAVLAMYVVVVLSVVIGAYRTMVLAYDLTDTWDFTTASNYTIDNGLETSGGSVRLKAQNYATDANTAALYHLDESLGTTVDDASVNANDGTTSGSPTFVTGNLNNGLDLDGTDDLISVPDSSSLSFTQSHTLEAWTKLDSSFSAGSHAQRQGIFDKGDYQLYYDNETGRLSYEIANASATTWTQEAGNDIKNSWDLNGNPNIEAQTVMGTNLYAGTGNATNDAEVWRWNGTSWTQIGGDGLNDSWLTNTYESVHSLANDGTNVYVGVGTGTGDAEVWSWNGTTWTKIGGDALNSSWAINTYEGVYSLRHFGGNLYAGIGNGANDAEVWRWNGTSWTKIGGDSLNSGWTTNYEYVYSLADDGTNLYAGLGLTAGEAEVWRWNGTAWTKIGGDTVNSSWDSASFEVVLSMTFAGGNLYAGLGTTADDAEVWSWNGTAWTKIGGDSLNSGWTTGYEGVYGLVSDGTTIYAGLGATAGDNELWSWNGTAWTKIGGDALNSSFTNTHTLVSSLAYGNSTLYVGLNSASATLSAQVWSYSASTWARIGGDNINFSWGSRGLSGVNVMTVSGDKLYAGTGIATAGTALVWEYDGSTWNLIGGQGVNSSWAAYTYETITTMISLGGNLYVGLGTTANDAEVWRWNGTTWTQIGGDSLNSGWTTNYEEVTAMAIYNSQLVIGLGNSANDAEVWQWNGAAWTKIGGDSLNSGWTTNFERVAAMANYNGQLYAGLGSSAGDAEVWRWNGTSWARVGGDAVNSSWDAINYEHVDAMIVYNGRLYAGLGTSTGDAQVWEYNGTAWTKMGGDDLNDSWTVALYERVRTLVVYNGDLYAGLGNTAGDGEVWKYNGTTWSVVAGDSLNSSWTNAIEEVLSFSPYKGKLYAGTGNSANADGMVWSFGNNGFLQSSQTTFDTNWHHVAATYDGASMKLFVDGTQVATTSVSMFIPDTTHNLLIGATQAGRESGKPSGHFQGLLDELRISNIARSSFTTKPYSETAQAITLNTPVHVSGIWHWDDFITNETPNGGTVSYRLSDDGGLSWKYWNGSAWVLSSSTAQTSTAAQIDTNILTFPATFSGIVWQAVLDGDGNQRVQLNEVELNSTSDVAAPATNASSITALKASGGSALSADAWTNGSSPYFDWTAGTDTESGIKGYCLYLGSDVGGDPVSTKGLLGVSPVTTGGNCQFIVGTSEIDLSTAGYMGSPLVTSSSRYYLRIKAIDNAGNVIGSAASFSFFFDNTAPTNPGFVTSPSGFINTKAVTLTWPTSGGSAASDGHSGLAGLQYRVNNTTWYGDAHTGTGDINDLLSNDGSYSTADPPDYDNLSDGINTIYFRTWDQAGNVTSSFVTATVKINTAGTPSEPQNVQATPGTNTVNAFTFSWDDPSSFVGDANNLTYCYTINALPNSTNCTFTPAGANSLGTGAYATFPGVNTFYIVARDEANNINYATFSSVNFTANTTAPGIPLNVDIVDVSIKSTNNWRLALTWDPPTSVGSGVASYRVFRSTDNSNFSLVGSSSSTTYIDAGLSPITYYYRVAACDNTNNCGANSSVVSLLPTGRFTSPASLVSDPLVLNLTTRRATVRWSTDRASDSKIAIGTTSGSYGPSEIGNSDQVSAHEINLDNLSAGTTYYFVAKWTDEDGNTGQSPEQSFTTSPAPTVKEIQPTKVSLSGTTIQFTSKDSTSVKIYYGPSESFGGVKTLNTSISESSYVFDLSGLADGTKYYFRLSAFDSEGGEYQGNIFSFSTPPRPKITNLRFQPIDGEPTSTQKVTWQTNVPSSTIVSYGKNNTVGTETQDSQLVTEHEIIIRDLEDDSDYYLMAQSRDADGNLAVSDRQQFRTALDTRPPKITNISIETAIRGTGAEARGQVIVSWTTDEPASSQIEYTEGSDAVTYNNKTAEDAELSLEHIVIVSDLPTSRVYSLRPVSRDRSLNAGFGDTQSAIIGRASDSVLTIILNTLKNVFGL
ncbi:MAG: LamG domain-containing protein [Candidatus Saccharibacteria bacterium]|nr:LamG domain-containing protein [Candidatus Saccharibacteria bacterium]